MDCSPPGSSVHGIFQARVMEWVSIAFSNSFLEDPMNKEAWQAIQCMGSYRVRHD